MLPRGMQIKNFFWHKKATSKLYDTKMNTTLRRIPISITWGKIFNTTFSQNDKLN